MVNNTAYNTDTIADNFAVIIFLLVMVAIARWFYNKYNSQTQKPTAALEDKAPKYLYRAKHHIMTSREEGFFRVLCDIFQDRYYVIPQVHLSSLLDGRIYGQSHRGAFSHINGKSVDYVLCSKRDLSTVCAIELDDSTHSYPSRVSRDCEVETIFKNSGIPLARFRNTSGLSDQEIVDAISREIKSVSLDYIK